MPSMCISANEEPEKILPAGLTLEPPRWWRGARIPRFCESWIVGSLTPKEGLLSPFLQVPSLSMKWWWKFLLIKKKKFLLKEQSGTWQPWLMTPLHGSRGTRMCLMPSNVVCSDDILLERSYCPYPVTPTMLAGLLLDSCCEWQLGRPIYYF